MYIKEKDGILQTYSDSVNMWQGDGAFSRPRSSEQVSFGQPVTDDAKGKSAPRYAKNRLAAVLLQGEIMMIICIYPTMLKYLQAPAITHRRREPSQRRNA